MNGQPCTIRRQLQERRPDDGWHFLGKDVFESTHGCLSCDLRFIKAAKYIFGPDHIKMERDHEEES